MFRLTSRALSRTMLSVILLLLPAQHIAAEVIDRVLVVVNEDVITESEFVSSMQQTISELRASNKPVPARAELEELVMERLILERVQLQIAGRMNISISEAQVDRAIADIAGRQSISAEELLQRVRHSGLKIDSYRREINKQLRIQRVIDREVRRGIVVGEGEVDEYIATSQGDGEAGKIEYEIAHILLTPDTDEESSELLNRASQVLAELRAGEDFGAVARRVSSSPNAARGGSLGFRGRDQLPDLFYDAAQKLEIGEISEPLDGGSGIHIIKLTDRRGGSRNVVEQWNVRHILVSIADGVSIREAGKTANLLLERLRQGEDFAKLASGHSDDVASRVKGGDLGWIGPGETLPKFEEAVRNLELNEFGGPVETRFGVHVLQVLDHRKKDVGNELLRKKAERAIREQKGRDAYDQWLRRIREEAYVKFRVKPSA